MTTRDADTRRNDYTEPGGYEYTGIGAHGGMNARRENFLNATPTVYTDPPPYAPAHQTPYRYTISASFAGPDQIPQKESKYSCCKMT
jgi:hypothetical protein